MLFKVYQFNIEKREVCSFLQILIETLFCILLSWNLHNTNIVSDLVHKGRGKVSKQWILLNICLFELNSSFSFLVFYAFGLFHHQILCSVSSAIIRPSGLQVFMYIKIPVSSLFLVLSIYLFHCILFSIPVPKVLSDL